MLVGVWPLLLPAESSWRALWRQNNNTNCPRLVRVSDPEAPKGSKRGSGLGQTAEELYHDRCIALSHAWQASPPFCHACTSASVATNQDISWLVLMTMDSLHPNISTNSPSSTMS